MSRDGHIEDVYGRPCWCGDTHNWSGIDPEPLPTEEAETYEKTHFIPYDEDGDAMAWYES